MQAAAEREETAVHRFTGGQRAYLAVKYGLDRCLGLVGLVLCSPILLVVALLIKREDGGPVLFKQPRIGYRGKVFDIYKFRSMRVGAEHTGSGVYSGKDDQRVTRIGRVLRATSLDELPQFLNLLKGECSLIGPRAPSPTTPGPGRSTTRCSGRCSWCGRGSPAGPRSTAGRAWSGTGGSR